jgi:hypothetical protein
VAQAVHPALDVPPVPQLAGLTLYEQVGQIDTSPLTQISSSNGLRIVIGLP